MSSSNTSRNDLIQNAVLFLQDPKTQSSPLTAKIEFLQSKGLDESEIQEALSRSSSSSSGSGSGSGSAGRGAGGNGGHGGPSMMRRDDGYGTRFEMAPVPPKRDWRDLFIMTVVSGGVAYGLATLAKKYLVPHLQPPSTTAFQSTSAEITAQYDEAAKLMGELQEQTGKLQSTLDEDRERVNKVVNEVEDAVQLVRDAEDTWREEMRDVRGEIEGIRDLVPRMIEKHSASQSSALSDLQSELKSLKTLLLSRQNIPQQPITSGTSTPNGNGNGTGASTATISAANALLGAGKSGGRSIPAWQMAPPKNETASASASGTASWTEAESMSGSALSESSAEGKGKERE